MWQINNLKELNSMKMSKRSLFLSKPNLKRAIRNFQKNLMRSLLTIEESLDVKKDTEGDYIKIKKSYTAGKTEAAPV